MDQQIMKKHLAAALGYSYTRMALNYYMYFEGRADEKDSSQWEKSFASAFQKILGSLLSGEGDLPGLENLRQKAMKEMEIITAYTDCFQVYEHVLNRVEQRFLPDSEKKALPEDKVLTREIMGFLAGCKDSAMVNERIQMIMEQLPIRFTKNKFFSMVQSGLSIYQGSPKSSLDAMMYVLRTESMLQLPENMGEGHEELDRILSMLRETDYKSLEKEEFKRLLDGLVLASGALLDASGELMHHMDLINDLYVLHLAGKDGVMEAKERQNLRGILSAIWEKLEEKDYSIPEDQVEEMLIQLEGQQERYYERWLRCDPAAFEEFSTGPSGEVYHRLRMVSLLLSGSSFVELEEKEEDKTEITGEVLEREEQKLFHDLAKMWAGMPKVVVRAIMARMLSNLPVCFNSLPEVEDYIESSLGSCTDPDEKMVSVELIREIMVELDEMV